MSLVGRNIRAILHQLGGAFEFFEEQKIHLVSQAANDLNFTFVVDEDQGDRLVEQLHELLIRPVPGDKVLGPTWQQLFSAPPGLAAGPGCAEDGPDRARASTAAGAPHTGHGSAGSAVSDPHSAQLIPAAPLSRVPRISLRAKTG